MSYFIDSNFLSKSLRFLSASLSASSTLRIMKTRNAIFTKHPVTTSHNRLNYFACINEFPKNESQVFFSSYHRFIVKHLKYLYLFSSLSRDSARSEFSGSLLRHCSINSGKRDKTSRLSLSTGIKDLKNRASASAFFGPLEAAGSCSPLSVSVIAPWCTARMKALFKSSIQTLYFNIQTRIYK